MGEALDSRDWIPIGCESGPESGRAKHWIAVIGSRLVVNHPMLLPYHFNPQHSTRTGEALDSRNWIPIGCESDPEPVGEALDSRNWIPIGCESDPESGRAKHWIVGIAPRMVVNQILNPDGRSIG